MTRLLELYDAFFAAAKRYPVEQEIQDILDPGREIRPSLSREADEWEGGIDDMIKGALQMAASRMLSQGTQESAGERQLIRGLRVIEAIREHNRKTVAASVRPGTLAKPNRKAPTKPTNRKPSRT